MIPMKKAHTFFGFSLVSPGACFFSTLHSRLNDLGDVCCDNAVFPTQSH